MGQKVHPTGIRLGIVKDWSSKWYADSKAFPKYISADHDIRVYIKKKLKDASVSRITIERPANKVNVTIHTARGEFLHRESMNTMHDRLAAFGFCRVHRSHIVNASRVDSLEHTAAGNCTVILHDGVRLPVSRSCKGALIGALACSESDD